MEEKTDLTDLKNVSNEKLLNNFVLQSLGAIKVQNIGTFDEVKAEILNRMKGNENEL